jgi:hypothetical protein
MNCKNCNTEISSKYCQDCGQAASLKRIDGHYILHEIEHVLHLDRGILYTIKTLTINPGKNIRNYFSENRNRLVKPIIFIIITSLIYSIITNLFHLKDGYINFLDDQQTTTSNINKWVQNNLGYSNILLGIFIAIWTKLFFRKIDYNLFEILILLCYVMGMGMLIYSLFAIIEGMTHLNLMPIAGIVGFIYTTWAVADFYDRKKVSAYVKSFFAYILGMLSFSLTIILIGNLIDKVIKH